MAELTIDALGKQGDGLARDDSRNVFVPYTLPGERVETRGNGNRQTLVNVLAPSADRVSAPCKHFGTCGGCQLQHMEAEAYESWKTGLVNAAMEQAGLDISVDKLFTFRDSGRRRAVFSAARIDGDMRMGFVADDGHSLVDIETCPVLIQPLADAMGDIRQFAASLPLGKKPVRLHALWSEAGLDLAVTGLKTGNKAQVQSLIRKSSDFGFARLTIDNEVLIEHRKPLLTMGIAQVTPPPGGFVQASLEAELQMAELTIAFLDGCKYVADLYSGIGTFALRLAQNAKVSAFEENQPAIDALDRAWRETGGRLKQLVSEVRNLDRRPVLAAELKRVDGLVFDPPRAGAELQSRQIARSAVQKVVAVSCNPVTLARDLITLRDGGYTIRRLVALDQFRFTPHIECIAFLEK